jgi:NADPH:quinone reductase-like Zn-dependent oxidoreductase
MLAVLLEDFDRELVVRDVPQPEPAANELLVRLRASSVNPADAAVAGGLLRAMAEYVFPVTLGRDFAGVVEAVGANVSRFGVGDEVFGYLGLRPDGTFVVRDGSWAELVVVSEDFGVGAAPHGVHLATAGASAVAGLTAVAALDALEPTAGDTVLVIGAAGGVGSLFVQLAAAAGATVIAPGLPEDVDYLRELGAAEVPARDAELPRGVDAVLDLVSFAPTSSELLHAGGRLASPLGAAGDGPGRTNLMAMPSPESLARLAGLLEAGELRVPIAGTFPLAEAPAALAQLRDGHTQGKLGIAAD